MTSNVKYFFKFLMIMTRKGSLMPRVFFGSAGQVTYVVDTFAPQISSTLEWISLSVMRLMCPFLTEAIADRENSQEAVSVKASYEGIR